MKKRFKGKYLSLLWLVAPLTMQACGNTVNDSATQASLERGVKLDIIEKADIQNKNTVKLSTSFNGINFKPTTQWHQVSNVSLAADTMQLLIEPGKTSLINRSTENLLDGGNLLITESNYQDVHIKFDFMLTKDTHTAVILMGRYRLNINDIFAQKKWWAIWMGGLQPRFDEREWKNYDGVIAKANPAKPLGEWQQLEINFKAPRFNELGYKTEYAQLVSVKFNDIEIHKNQVVTGPTGNVPFVNEAKIAPVYFVGNTAQFAIKNLNIESRDYSQVAAAKELSIQDSIPLGAKQGKPMFNVVNMGEKAFKNKGCKECHEVNPSAKSVKTGPGLYGIFSPKVKQLTVFDPAENHKSTVNADKEYFMSSIRKSSRHIAVRKQRDGIEKVFLPIMPSFNGEIIKESEAEALYAYLLSLNPLNNQGPTVIWQESPQKPYILADDLTAELVSDKVRIGRVNIGDNVSGRAYHVGLPNQMNYSFDTQTLAVKQVWAGRFLDLKSEKKGRADAVSKIGKNAKLWPKKQLYNFLQPITKEGHKVDFSFKESSKLSAQISSDYLQDTTDFNQQLKSVDANFIGVETPLIGLPGFNYRVNNNYITVNFDISVKGQLTATMTLDNPEPQSFYIGLNDGEITVSNGTITDGILVIDAGVNQQVTLTGNLVDVPLPAKNDDNIVAQSNKPQALIWTTSNSKKATLPQGYELQDALAPNDKFGRQVLFEPLGIAFSDQGNAFISTRTSGVWKVTDNQWQQFAEGVFDSLGVVSESDTSIVIGEKPGLTRLLDENDDGISDRRESLSADFRFNSNYHEYLHGPARFSDGSLLYTLNLGHSLPGGYGGEGSMTTTGGYRGWALSVSPEGNTTPFAFGLRSPAGLAIDKADNVFYTDNQGDFHGTSKLYRLNKDKYYGHPAGLVDLPNMISTSPEIKWTNYAAKRELPIGLLPHGRAMNSPGSPIWDESDGGFGPYDGQMFIGDQSQSTIFRVNIDTVNGVEQSALLPFMANTASGAMRLTFSPNDNSLWIGQTGRGWWAKGGNLASLQRIVWDSTSLPQSIHEIHATPHGYQLQFTKAVAKQDRNSFKQLTMSSWYYVEDYNYGSEEYDVRDEELTSQTWSDDGKSLFIVLANFEIADKTVIGQTSRVYEFDLTATAFGQTVNSFHAKAWYTLHQIPNE
ncbi:family 16 glycoside hydrolase [Shewanella sp. 10N.286.48.B5]|uniref:family 16 glycoside hydrolase n=1 Tax=Shewanella sp. 10N.286.48.B5 TaxID=1880834 RepID=UPI000CC60857|nr:family 16 glycoside hydrolase [Shewanella sp. 10N.286.48.B5]PMH87370.1 hypothetical protein BCU57_07320 [Shewanella sp. 10N.286.48.B5]